MPFFFIHCNEERSVKYFCQKGELDRHVKTHAEDGAVGGPLGAFFALGPFVVHVSRRPDRVSDRRVALADACKVETHLLYVLIQELGYKIIIDIVIL